MNRLFCVCNVLRDMLSDKTRRQISLKEVSVSCQRLAQIISNSYEPDLVVAIDSGGSIPGELVARELHVPIVHVVIRRNINIVRKYSLDPIPLRWIMSMYHHYLFQTVTPVISMGVNVNIRGKKILVVDDSLHTGATIDITLEHLRKGGISEVQVAALSYVHKRKPDFWVMPCGNYSFPWSKDFKKINA